MKRAATLLLIAAALLGGGCAATSSSNSTTTTPVAPAAPAPTSQRPAAAVTIRRLTFIPPTVTIHVGQTVKWINRDNVSHNVTAENGTTFQSPTFAPGGTFTYKPVAPGTFAYTCTIHPDMMATLIVKP